MVNRTLGDLLRFIYGEKKKQLVLVLAQAKFAYNSEVHSLTIKLPSDIFYRKTYTQTMDLFRLSNSMRKSVVAVP